MIKIDFQNTPDEVVNYLKNKELLNTFNYDEIKKEAHDKAFTVAKVTRTDLLSDIHDSLQDSFKGGKNFEAWKKELIPTLEKKGWWGTQELVNPKTGEIRKVVINSRRLKTIYSTNLRVNYQKQRHKEMMQLPMSVYWMYRSALLETTRDSHRKMHGLVFHRNHPFWKKNYPPNDWNCYCSVTAHSKQDLERRGITPTESSVENIAGKDWDYDVGADTNLRGLNKINLDNSLEKLPLLESVKDDSLKDLGFDALKNMFFGALAVKEGKIFIDKVNDPITITDDFFKSLGNIKIHKQNRNLYLLELANALSNPDEIYLDFEPLNNPDNKYVDKNSRTVKKYIKYYKTKTGAKRSLIVIVEYQKDKTVGVSAYVVDSQGAVETKRAEKLIYQKD